MTRIATSNYAGDAATTFEWATAGTDRFSRVNDLYALAQALENHDHSSGKGLSVGRVVNGLIDTLQLASGAVTADKLGADAITAVAVALDAIGALELADNAVDTAAIVNVAVTNGKLATDSVDARTILAAAVGTAEIADGAITQAKHGAASVGTAEIIDGSLTAAKYGAGQIIQGKLASDAVITNNIVDGHVTTAKIADVNVTTAKLADDAVTPVKLATSDTAVGSKYVRIAAGDITKFEYGDLPAASSPNTVGDLKMVTSASITARNAAGWLLCNGQTVSRSTHSALFTDIGTAFGAGDGSTTFTLPDFRDKFPIGVSGTKIRGATGGAAIVDASHGHTAGASAPSSTENVESGSSDQMAHRTHGHAITVAAGGSTTLAIVPPYQAVNYMIYSGVAT